MKFTRSWILSVVSNSRLITRTHSINTLLSLTKRLYLSHVTTVWRPLSVAAVAQMNDEIVNKTLKNRILKRPVNYQTIDSFKENHVSKAIYTERLKQIRQPTPLPHKAKLQRSAHSMAHASDRHLSCSFKSLEIHGNTWSRTVLPPLSFG